MSRDLRAVVVEHYAAGEQQLLERLASVEEDRDCYRELLVTSLDQLHDLKRSHERLRDQHARLVDEYRHLREQVMTTAWPAA